MDVIGQMFEHACKLGLAFALELSTFAVTPQAKMLRDFKVLYYKRWHDERQPS
ncbi:hypothetical protein JQ597_33355 [Bradyrhizobium sp. AUGA SZCCT0177]|uniref:hypothetical protein n=1 Tax=Bradyrhizobium sp. AUGA SZCCT0177 TaxID=2807665 RepID=UPI001BA8B236|nr:hypothetical protein [Bradyrhizobium sp. AUGA SZCCT0177]MBR1286951.1 hypothetical protein [Bradyrhizobium sp. AUGA SZCCT0177]